MLAFAMLSLVIASPTALGKSELETLRARCAEQERQIRLLEEENAKLRPAPQETAAVAAPKSIVAATLKPAPEAKVVAKSKETPATPATYRVKAGDNIDKIARRAGTKPEQIAKLNGIKVSSIIQIGQVLKLPNRSAATAPAAKVVPVVEKSTAAVVDEPVEITKNVPVSNVPVSAPTALISDAVPTKKIKPITVDGEMTYGEFASKHHTDTERLNALNGLDLTTATILAKGSELYVPTQQ